MAAPTQADIDKHNAAFHEGTIALNLAQVGLADAQHAAALAQAKVAEAQAVLAHLNLDGARLNQATQLAQISARAN